METEVESHRYVLNPEVIWVDGRCYRKPPTRGGSKTGSEISKSVKPKPVIEEEEDDYNDLPIQLEKNRFWLRYSIPAPLLGFVIGKFGSQKTAIEEATSTELKIPSKVQGNKQNDIGDIVILGTSKKAVVNAYNRISYIIHDARWKVGDYTHFISIPMNSREIQDGYLKFKEEVLQNAKGHGVNESCFEEPSRLHLTITMLTLLDSREIESAKELLLKHKSEIFEILAGKTLRVQMKGVEYMNDDPSEVNILYGKVGETDSDNCLQMISDKLANAFVKVNFSRKEYDAVKLHVTLMKSRNNDKGERTTFDARKILQKYADYNFGRMTISEIHISLRFSHHKGYYRPSFVLKLDS